MQLLQFRLTRYNTLVLPLLDYGDTVWGDKNNSILMEYLQLLQNKAAKIILDRHPQPSAYEALDSPGWKQLHLRRRFHRCTTIFKCLVDFIFIIIIIIIITGFAVSLPLTQRLRATTRKWPKVWYV